jgi:hypothetical protein
MATKHIDSAIGPVTTIPPRDPNNAPQLYTPLDHSTHSIRLIRISPHLSRNGHIECEMRLANISSAYTCLSYVWGPAPSSHTIFINAQAYSIRNNLFSFLRYARKKSLGWLWIDAVCIDQENVAERTHQVQQMGLIFSHAEVVVSWLGTCPDIVGFLHRISDAERPPYSVMSFSRSSYWTRAWVTQEIVLAKSVMLMAGDAELPMESLPEVVKTLTGALFPGGDRLELRRGSGRDMNLFDLLHRFRHQQCEIPRDRIFSLLALCKSNIKVDYVCSSEELGWDIVKSRPKAFCICIVYLIGLVLAPKPYVLQDDPRCFPQNACANFIIHKIRDLRDRDVQDHEKIVIFIYSCEDSTWATRRRLDFEEYMETRAASLEQHPQAIVCIDLISLCGHSRVALAILFYHDKTGFMYLCIDRYDSNQLEHWPEDLDLDLDCAADTTIRLSLNFLFHLTLMTQVESKPMGCCIRARSEHDNDASNVLTLADVDVSDDEEEPEQPPSPEEFVKNGTRSWRSKFGLTGRRRD